MLVTIEALMEQLRKEKAISNETLQAALELTLRLPETDDDASKAERNF